MKFARFKRLYAHELKPMSRDALAKRAYAAGFEEGNAADAPSITDFVLRKLDQWVLTHDTAPTVPVSPDCIELVKRAMREQSDTPSNPLYEGKQYLYAGRPIVEAQEGEERAL